MIIFLYGSDTYRSRQKLNEIIERYQKIHKSGLNFKNFDLNEKELQELKDEARLVSMFVEKKLFVFKNAIHNKNFQEEFFKNAKYFIDSKDIFLFYEEEISEKEKFFNFLKKKGKSQEFRLLSGQQLKNWAKKEFKKYKCQVGEKAIEKLIEFIGNDLWRFSNEIKKLVNFKKEEVEEGDIELLVKPKIETDIFKTIDALASKNKKMALELIHQHLEKGDHPLYLLSMITFQFRNLLAVKDLLESNFSYYDILRKSNLHPYVVRKSCQQAKKFTLGELKKIYQKIFEVDLNIKTGRLDFQTALDLLIAEI